jgi:hypothetical protein
MLAEGKLQVDAGGCAIWVSPGVFTIQPGVDETIQCRPRLYGLGLGLPPSRRPVLGVGNPKYGLYKVEYLQRRLW